MRKIQFPLICLVLVAIFLIGIFTSPLVIPQPISERIGVVVTILPLAEFVERVGGDRVHVTVMVPLGASPHAYEPTPSQLVEVSKAKIYIQVGSGVEFELVWMGKIIDVNRDLLVINSSQGIQPVGKDPHVWLSPRNAKIMVENIYKALAQIDPQNREYYGKNAEEYIKALDDLDKGIREVLSKVIDRKFMVYHPSWGYFAREYNLTQIAIEEEGKEPTAAGIAALIKQAKELGIKVIFVSSQFSTKNAEVIAREIGGRVVSIDPLAKDYLKNLRLVAEEIAEGVD